MRVDKNALLALLLSAITAGLAGAADETVLEPRIERVALFKNGLAYFTAAATLPQKATRLSLGRLPVPVHGTFWLGYGKDVRPRALSAALVDVEEQLPIADFATLLAQNVGRKVRISASGDSAAIEGTIVSSAPRPVKAAASPYLMADPTSEHDERGGSPLVTIRTDRGLVMLNPGSISRVDFDGNSAVTTARNVLRRPTVRLELEKPAGGASLALSYLARGVTWAPSYLIDISDPKTARLSASALVVNEVADLENVHLDLVTGFPNVQFAAIASPIGLSQSLEGFLGALGQGSGAFRTGNMLSQQAMVMSNAAPFDERPPSPSYGGAAVGRVTEDLFLYPIDGFSLKRGETAYLPLFSADAPYAHVYVWRIPDSLDEQDRYAQDQKPRSEEVWHSARLTNPLAMPLTTAPAQFVSDGRLAGQDVCHFTAPGAETTIRINRAMNVVAGQTEVEFARKRDAARFYGRSYDLVTLRGELRLSNRMDRSASVEISKELSGELAETIPAAKDTRTAKGLRQVNTSHTLVWTIALQPGEERTLTYTYDVYIYD